MLGSAVRRAARAAELPKLLLTPGPLTTSPGVREAMAKQDFGSRDKPFIQAVKDIRSKLLSHLGVDKSSHQAILVQGAGTCGIEAMLSSLVPRDGNVLIVSNGVYGLRQRDICNVLGIKNELVEYPHHDAYCINDIDKKLTEGDFSHVSVIHHETTAGVLNPLEETGRMLADKHPKVRLFVDSMSAAGAYACPVKDWNIACIVSSSNKNYGGVPGFSWLVTSHEVLAESKGHARVFTLDLHAQLAGLEKNGQFRFTPPTHAMVAFLQALKEWEAEGGREVRLKRYQDNADVLIEGMSKLGFKCYVPDAVRGCIITSFLVPNHPRWDFDVFYDKLNDAGFAIYPGSMTKVPTFRVGNIGHIFTKDMIDFIICVEDIMAEMGMTDMWQVQSEGREEAPKKTIGASM